MHTFRKSKDEPLWTVGFQNGVTWMPIEDFEDEKAAAAYVNYLNGGNAFVEVAVIPE